MVFGSITSVLKPVESVINPLNSNFATSLGKSVENVSQVPGQALQSVNDLLSSPMLLIGVGAVVVIVLLKK